MEKNTVIKYVMGFESWEGEYTAVQLINNNGLTRVLAGCFLWAAQPPQKDAAGQWEQGAAVAVLLVLLSLWVFLPPPSPECRVVELNHDVLSAAGGSVRITGWLCRQCDPLPHSSPAVFQESGQPRGDLKGAGVAAHSFGSGSGVTLQQPS